VIQSSLRAVERPRAASLAGLLAGLLLVPLPGVAAGSAHGTNPRTLQQAGTDLRLVQGGPAQTSAEAQVQELIQQANALQAKGAYAEAALLWQQFLAIVEGVLGTEHPLTASSLNNLAAMYEAQGRYREAEPLYKRSLGIIKKVLGPEHPLTATSFNNLAVLYRALGRSREAELLHRRSLAIREKVLGPEHLDTAASLNNLAELYRAQGRYGEAETISKRSLAIREKVLGPEHPDTAQSLNNLAALYQIQGRYGEAEPLYKRSLEIIEKAQGPKHPSTATGLNNLAELFRAQGRFGEAEPLYKRSLAICEQAQGLEHPNTAGTLNNLAEQYRAQGRYGEAEPLYQRSLAIREKALGPWHSDTAGSLNNLAELYRAQGRYGEAESRYERSLAIMEKTLGPMHPDTAISLNNLAGLYRAQVRYGEAETLYKRSLAIRKTVLGPEHPVTATSLNNLALLYDSQGRYGEAERLYKRSLAISEKALGTEHPDTTTILYNLALMHLARANAPAAEPLVQRLNRAQVNWLRRELPLQPRELRSRLIDQLPDAFGTTFALLDQSPAAAPLALETRLNRQGLLAEIERRQAFLKASSPEMRRLAEQLAGIDRQLASITLPPAQREPLRQQRQQLENQLYRLVPALKIEHVTNAQVAAALKSAAPQGLLVEFQNYQPYRKGGKGKGEWGAARYVALLLKPDGTIRAIPLGPAAPIDAAVAEAVAASASSDRQAEALARLAVVSQLVLKPLQAELAGVGDLFVSPDGDLNRLPFAALPVGATTGPALGESLRLRLLTTGRELVRLQQPSKGGNATTLITAPDFNAASLSSNAPEGLLSGGNRGAAASNLQPAGTGLRGLGPWPALPGTAAEAKQLAPLLRPKALISGPQATATLVLQQQAPRILHVATHGFVLSDQPPPSQGISQAGPLQPRATRGTAGTAAGPILSVAPSLSFEFLERSGLVFAGANQPSANPADDGYLTAAEATAMDLEGTELVTLSACETALGGMRSGEGVYGLQRALAVAGARSTLLSLWKVDDDLTALFMEEFYKRLKAGEGRADALRNTQAWFRTNPSSTLRDVRVWGAFQLSGDWRTLPGW
jgi:CHAT domain-containing protein/tetratricopeptide (TPR) repeat protein